MTALRFELPPGREASSPPAQRDAVRLMIAGAAAIRHARFAQLGSFLEPGDLVVVNTSGTLSAAVEGARSDGRLVTVHFATGLDDGDWVVEVRPRRRPTGPVGDLSPSERIALPHAVLLTVLAPHPAGQQRLWRARVPVDGGVVGYLARIGRPIRYAYVPRRHPPSAYQTVFAREPGSAELPSAGRPFTHGLVTDLVTRGIAVAPVLLHAGVSSQDAGEPPQPERFRVPEPTARLVNATRASRGRVVAVGTTVTRALESAVVRGGVVREREGWTDLVLGAEHPARVVNGLITGWHAPGASHLQLLEAVAGGELVAAAYVEALHEGYRWHEFGDSCLLLP